MSELIDARAGTAVLHSCDAHIPATMASLPLELLTAILGYLDRNDQLRQAAAVSRIFYTAAWQAGLIFEKHIRWIGSKAPKLEIFDEIVQHAARRAPHIRLGLSLSLRPAAGRAYRDSVMPQIQRIFALITAALPVLVRLSLQIHVHFSNALAHALCYAAPRLEELVLDLHCVSDRTVPTVPSDLFAGAAPRLRKAVLRDAYLGLAPVPAFSGITKLSLVYCNHFPDTALAAHFPRLFDLSLEFFSDSAWAEPPARLDNLRSLRLRRLSVCDEERSPLMPAVAASTDLRAIPDVEHACDMVEWTPPPGAERQDLSVRICPLDGDEHGTVMRVSPCVRPRMWRRMYYARDWPPDTLAPLAELPEDTVTRLHLHVAYLARLLDTPQLPLGALRELHVDLHQGFTMPNTIAVPGQGCPCAHLQVLRLCARDPAWAFDAGAVASLGRALGLVPRRAVLELAGVQLVGASTLLDKRFSSVRVVAPDCREDDEDGYSWE